MTTPFISRTYGDLLHFIMKLQADSAVLLCIALLLSMLCCLEGYHLQRLIIGIAAFAAGYSLAANQLPLLIAIRPEQLLPASLAAALVFAAVAYKIYLAGIFTAVFYVAASVLPDLLHFGIYTPAVSFFAASAAAGLAVKLNRTVIIALTSVAGGFAMVHFFLKLIPLLPFTLEFPPAGSPVYLYAGIFLSGTGAVIQLLTPEKAMPVVHFGG